MAIENSQKCFGCITQSAAEYADALDRAIAFVFKAADDSELILGVAHHKSDIDVSRCGALDGCRRRDRALCRDNPFD